MGVLIGKLKFSYEYKEYIIIVHFTVSHVKLCG